MATKDNIKVELPKAKEIATPAEIKQWKATHPRIVEIVSYNAKMEAFKGYFTRPGIKELSLCETKENRIQQMELMYTNCKLKVDEEVEKDEELKYSMMVQISSIFKVRLAEVKEL